MKLVMIENRWGRRKEIENPCCRPFGEWWGSIFQLYEGKPSKMGKRIVNKGIGRLVGKLFLR